MKQRKLGCTQMSVLEALVEHKGWMFNCGWLWDTPSHTEKLMEQLVARGFVKKTPRKNAYGNTRDFYQATAEGKRLVQEQRTSRGSL